MMVRSITIHGLWHVANMLCVACYQKSGALPRSMSRLVTISTRRKCMVWIVNGTYAVDILKDSYRRLVNNIVIQNGIIAPGEDQMLNDLMRPCPTRKRPRP